MAMDEFKWWKLSPIWKWSVSLLIHWPSKVKIITFNRNLPTNCEEHILTSFFSLPQRSDSERQKLLQFGRSCKNPQRCQTKLVIVVQILHEETRTFSCWVSIPCLLFDPFPWFSHFLLLFLSSLFLFSFFPFLLFLRVFSRILEAVSLLSLSKGAVLLLQEALESGDGEQCLKDVHVETLPEEVVRAVLKKDCSTEMQIVHENKIDTLNKQLKTLGFSRRDTLFFNNRNTVHREEERGSLAWDREEVDNTFEKHV